MVKRQRPFYSPGLRAADGFFLAHALHMLETRDLTIRFGGHVAVNAVSCAFEPGTLTAIVGPNGAGKTTYFNLISGSSRPAPGTVTLGGRT
jgi:branched-chain amino acid transport system ATP-binding protein